MAQTIKHAKVSAVPDGSDTNQVQPTDWNADHSITGTVDYSEISGKPATFPPTVPIAQSNVTNLVTDLAAKAPLASPALTGVPTAPTAANGTNTTQLATTAFVEAEAVVTAGLLAAKAPLASPALTGVPTAPTAAAATNTTQLATTAFVTTADNLKANIASPTFTGTPAAPTPTAGDNDTSIATTAFVHQAKRSEVVTALTDGATPALNAALGNVFTLTAAGDRTIAVPTSPTAGQKIIIIHLASGADRTLALNTGAGGFRFGSTITGLTPTISAKKDYIGAIYNGADSRWDVVAYSKGF